MGLVVWTKLALELKLSPRSSGVGVSEDVIREAEASVGCTFSNGYRKFLRRYGSADLAFPVFGLSPCPALGTAWSVVEATRELRADQWPGTEDLYIVSDDGTGNPVGGKADGSFVLCAESHEVVPIGDFDEFLRRALTGEFLG